jgi:hypothetical protein
MQQQMQQQMQVQQMPGYFHQVRARASDGWS